MAAATVFRFGDADGRAFESISVSTVAIGPTATTLIKGVAATRVERANRGVFTIETNSIRIRYDGTAPTASEGHLMTAGDSFIVEGADNLSRLLMIRASADATIKATYEW